MATRSFLMTGTLDGQTFTPSSVYPYTDAATRAAVLATAQAERIAKGLMILDFPSATFSVVKAMPDADAVVWGGMNLAACQQMIDGARSVGTENGNSLANTIQAAVDAWEAAGN